VSELASLLPLLAIFALFWLLVIRPAHRRQKRMRTVQQELSVGDEVLTNAGIFGTVARLDGDRIGLEVADGVVVSMARGAVVSTTAPAEAQEDTEASDPTGTTDASNPTGTTDEGGKGL
jgi:preprotein translocase subunit YajC